jgi:hypothetical protein
VEDQARTAWDWLGGIADLTSLVMLPITAYAAWKVRSLSAKVAFNVRAPQTLDRVDELAEQVFTLLKETDRDVNLVVSLVMECEAQISSLGKGVSGVAGESAKELKLMLVDFENRKPTGEEAVGVMWMLYNKIKRFCIHARGLHQDRQTGVSNDS